MEESASNESQALEISLSPASDLHQQRRVTSGGEGRGEGADRTVASLAAPLIRPSATFSLRNSIAQLPNTSRGEKEISGFHNSLMGTSE